MPQVKEILTGYGDLCLIWFDTPMTITPVQSRRLVDMVHTYQPDCLVNSRVGNGMGDYTSMGDNEIPDAFMQGGLFESACTLNDTWGYKSYDGQLEKRRPHHQIARAPERKGPELPAERRTRLSGPHPRPVGGHTPRRGREGVNAPRQGEPHRRP